MKRRFFITLTVVLCAATSFAQITLGIKAGYNTSLGFDENWTYNAQNVSFANDWANGFNVGLMSRFGNRYYGQLEVLYNRNYTSYKLNDVADKKIVLQSIDIPLLFGVKIIDKRLFNWRVMAGPNFSFDVNSRIDLPEQNWLSYTTRKVLIGLDCGTGFDIWHFAIDVRYKLIQNRHAYQYRQGSENVTINKKPMNNFEVSLAWKFLDKKKSNKK